MHQEFQAAYKELNAAQKRAVDTIEGPLLVVAGPGTGKTQLLSLRVANILKQTDTDPSSILCLTFTNFAATNMRDRLSHLVGPSAHNVVVRTFHSFAAEIMELYPDYFWNGARLTIAPDTVQLQTIQAILSELPLDNPLALRFAGAYTALNDVQQALRLTKEAGLTPEKLLAMIGVNEAYLDIVEPTLTELLSSPLSFKKLPALQAAIEALPDHAIDSSVAPLTSLSTVIKESFAAAATADQALGKTTQTSKWKRQWLQTVDGHKGLFDERRRNTWWGTLAGVYATYRDRLHEQQYYDYSDMIIEVITQLEQHAELLAGVQERFLYVMIDEFQDTNAAQLRLAHLVATHHSSEGKPNLMAVGDDDQSIFAFNGAELNNMLAFRRTYPTTKTIVLEDNYRSTQPILDTATAIIEQADDRLIKRDANLTKNLRARAKLTAGTIQHLNYPTREQQMSAIAKRIQQEYQQADQPSIAVLARQHSSLRELSAVLNELQVPIAYEQQNNALDQPLVQQLTLLANIIWTIGEGNNSLVNYYLAQLLRHPVWQVSDETLWQLALHNNAPRTTSGLHAQWLESLLKHEDVHLVTIAKWLLWLSRQAYQEPLAVIWEYMLGLKAGSHMTSPLREYFLAHQRISNEYLVGLSAFHTIQAAVYELKAAPGQQVQLNDFIALTELHQSLNKPITDESWFVSGDHAVELMTVYKAKGLEFDTVFVLDLIEDNWRPRHLGRKPPANLPLQPYGEQYDDYVRLLYVAATRAKCSLIVSSYQLDGKSKPVLASPLIQGLPSQQASDNEAPIPILETALSWPRLETTDEQALLRRRLQNYQLSATALLQFLDVSTGGPQQFLERHLLRLPEPVSASMAFGTAIHYALQTAQLLVNKDRLNMPAVRQAYETSLLEQQLSQADRTRYYQHGLKLLKRLLKDKDFLSLQLGDQPEVEVRDTILGQAKLAGKFDLINLVDGELLITDYKTGIPLTSFTTRDQTKAIKAWRHRNQLLFYTLLARQSSRFKAQTIQARMLYVEAEKPSELSLVLAQDEASLERLQKLIAVAWQHITSLNLPDTRHYSDDITGITAFEDDLIDGKI